MTESTHSQLSTFNSQNLHWFAVRVSYSRELTLKSILDKENIESFIPMCYGMVMKGGKRVRRLVPAIHNLVFVHSTRKRIDALKDELEGTNEQKMISEEATNRGYVLLRNSDILRLILGL